MEGVRFRGKRVDMEIYDGTLRSWEGSTNPLNLINAS
jgi:hypothetical protein